MFPENPTAEIEPTAHHGCVATRSVRNVLKAEKIASSVYKPGIERVQALADISRSALCCHSNETRAPIANPQKNSTTRGYPKHSANLHPGPCNSGMWRRTDTQTHRHTDGRDHYTLRLGYASREM